ncbi:MAG: type II toxin-antitoxin system VapC family toxin [Burkholderiaceae bacterium]|jgi:predicted nucleic acid-binding protein|nr:type II toxin-antitoxin system VapC family toxin [Burkholderiaceae bacterium]
MFLLDTNVIAELRKAGDGKADAGVTAWLAGRDASSFYISAITLMEIEWGILLLARRDARQAARLRAWMDTRVVPEFAERTLPVDRAVALRCAGLHVPDPRIEGVNKSGASEQVAGTCPIKAQSAAIPRGISSICNDERARFGGMSGRGGFVHTLLERDAWIAATALVHGMAVVTRNVVDFAPTGVEVIDLWRHS